MNLNEQLKKFFKDNEWNINKLKGDDVFYYIEENFKLDINGELEYQHKLGFQSGFGEGAESRQVEIDQLQNTLKYLTKDYQELTEMYIQQGKIIYELQKRVDELQEELEVLQGMYNTVSLTAGELVDERDVLQKRIDEALDHTINHGGCDNLTHIIKILKGKV